MARRFGLLPRYPSGSSFKVPLSVILSRSCLKPSKSQKNYYFDETATSKPIAKVNLNDVLQVETPPYQSDKLKVNVFFTIKISVVKKKIMHDYYGKAA